MAAVEVHDDRSLREHLLDGVVAGTDEAGILLGVLLDMPHGPEQSVGRLVAHLHPTGLYIILLQEREHIYCVVAHVAEHLLVRVVFPGCGDGLLGGVGPRVGIVEVDHEIHAQRLHPTGHDEQRVLVAVAAPRIHPDAHADSRHLVVVLQKFEALALLSVTVMKLHSSAFLPKKESHIGALYEIFLDVLCGHP